MSDADRTAKRFIVSGRVQGVGFRFFVMRQAQALGLAGWVRNLPDGRVEAFIEGALEPLERIEELLREGPSAARVKAVESSQSAPSLATEFETRG